MHLATPKNVSEEVGSHIYIYNICVNIYIYLYPYDIPIFVTDITIFFAASPVFSQPLASLSPGECRGCRHFRGFWDATNAARWSIYNILTLFWYVMNNH